MNDTNSSDKCADGWTQDEEGKACVMRQFFLSTVLGGTLCIVGLIGNTVSFVVLKKDKQTPIASMLLRALAFADNFFLMWWLIHIAVRNLHIYAGVGEWSSPIWGPIFIYLYPFLFVGQSCTIWMTVFIAFTRYFAVCRPYTASRVWNTSTIRNGIILVFVGSFLYNVPRFFEYKSIRYEYCNKVFYPPVHWLLTGEGYRIIYFDVMYYIFSFALPLTLLAILNIRLIVAYREVQRKRQRLLSNRNSVSHVGENGGPEASDAHRDPNITLVMIVVILIFMLCNLPAKLVQIVWQYDIQPCLSYQFLLIQLSNVLEVLNSSSNFAVYCVCRQQFRRILRDGPCCQTVGAQMPANQTDIQATHSLLNGTAKMHVTCQDTKV